MTEKWAKDCARYERGGAQEYLRAAIEYEKQWEKGSSYRDIAEAVTVAGFPIHDRTVRRRVNALEEADRRTRRNTRAHLEAFAEAYATENAVRGGGGSLPPEEARRVYLEGVVGEFERLFSNDYDLTDEDRQNVQRLRDHCDEVLAGRPVLKLVKSA